MANDENLIPAKKGDVRNPNGRPKGSRNRSTILNEMLERAAVGGLSRKEMEALDPKTVGEQVIASLIVQAAKGDVSAIKEIQDTSHGKLTDKVDNQHSFSRMGRVTAQLAAPEGDERGPETVELSFDVGSEPNKPEGQYEDE